MTGKQNAFVMYARMFLYTLVALMLRLIALSPLACLFLCDGWLRLLAVFCPVMLLAGILPLRWSFAQAAADPSRRFSFDAAFSFSHYTQKLKEGLFHALHVLKWGVPLAAMFGGAYYCYTQVDALTLFQTINDLGNTCAQALSGIAGFLPGGADGTLTSNNFMLGAGAVAAVFGLGALIWAWGVVRNSASRYIWAIAIQNGRDPRAERRLLLKGRRLLQLGVGLINLLLFLPFLFVTFAAVKSAVSDLSTMLMMAITTGQLPKAELIKAAVPSAAAFVLLYLPLLPLRRMNTAAFVLRGCAAKAEKKVSA